MRDLTGHVDRFGNISVDVEIGGGPGAAAETTRATGSNAPPAIVARFLRELADDVERAQRPGVGNSGKLFRAPPTRRPGGR